MARTATIVQTRWRRPARLLSSGILLLAGAQVAVAADTKAPSAARPASAAAVVLPPGVTEDLLAPPPMPRFMLDRNARKLTPQQMAEEARAASLRAGKPPSTPSSGAASPTSTGTQGSAAPEGVPSGKP